MAKWFRNLKTGHAWEIADEALAERLSASRDFEEMIAPAKTEPKRVEPEPLPEAASAENEDVPKRRKTK